MSTYEVLHIGDGIVVVKDYSVNGMTITLSKEEFEKWKAIKDRNKKVNG